MRGVGPSGVGDKRTSERLETDRKPQAVNISCPQGNQGSHPTPLHFRNSPSLAPLLFLWTLPSPSCSHPLSLEAHASLHFNPLTLPPRY